jgi:hypothetical protein
VNQEQYEKIVGPKKVPVRTASGVSLNALFEYVREAGKGDGAAYNATIVQLLLAYINDPRVDQIVEENRPKPVAKPAPKKEVSK